MLGDDVGVKHFSLPTLFHRLSTDTMLFDCSTNSNGKSGIAVVGFEECVGATKQDFGLILKNSFITYETMAQIQCMFNR